MNTFSMSYFQGAIPNEEDACGAPNRATGVARKA